MANIFKENKAVNEHPNRNNFDLSKKSNVSLKFGTLYPVYCQPVVPGDSFDINVAYNLKLMPVVFPVQTKMRAHMHFFYVRNKNLWSNWENWISNLPNASQSLTPHPYISRPDTEFMNGSIHDFLGVPTSLVNHSGISYSFRLSLKSYFADDILDESHTTSVISSSSYSSSTDNFIRQGLLNIPTSSFQSFGKLFLNFPDIALLGDKVTPLTHFYTRFAIVDEEDNFKSFSPFLFDHGLVSPYIGLSSFDLVYDSDQLIKIFEYLNDNFSTGDSFYVYLIVPSTSSSTSEVSSIPCTARFSSSEFEQYGNLNIPLYSQHLHLNALPYRAYESIYWAYYNNNVVSPMTINGDVQYNRYNTNLGDGADTTDYHLFQRNYELDFLTSSLPSPQQGVAPLVGMTALGDVTIEDENGITTAHAEIDNDGTITKVVLTSPAASVEHARTAMNIAASGMSINDFRQTNALQRVLETNIRKGYRYMDFIAGHFGKEPEYRELDMPEFIGGFSRDVNVSTVVSQADTLGSDSGKSLGSYGGFAQVVGGSNHSIRHYCDDYGYIIGILSVVPTPCYSQLLPKHMIAPDNFLDYYFPEFSQSGLMPITYKEVAPIQSYIDSLTDSSKSLEDTFGYQRPNYDMVSAVDEVHGEFRGALRDYVINRIFSTRPELGRSFLQINPSEINDIFVNTNPDDDTIIGEIGFAVYAKRPVPRVVIPNLGR